MKKWIQEEYPDLMVMDGFDGAIIGVVERIGIQAVCYSEKVVIDLLMIEHKMDAQEAHDYMDFNMKGAWVGEHTPFFLKVE